MIDDGSVDVADTPTDVGEGSVLVIGGATHFVQIVEIEVRVTVEMVVVTSSRAWVPEVTMLVTGQVVKVV